MITTQKIQANLSIKMSLINDCRDCLVMFDIDDIITEISKEAMKLADTSPQYAGNISVSCLVNAQGFSTNDRYYVHNYLIDRIQNMGSFQCTEKIIGKDDNDDHVFKVVDITVEAENVFCKYILNIFFTED